MASPSEPTQPEHSERVHHPYSPSSLQSREACPCYDGEDSGDENRIRAAIRGTLQHEAMETGADNHQLTDVEWAAVRDCSSYVAVLKNELGEGFHEIVEPYVPIDDQTIQGRGSDGQVRAFKGTTAGYLDLALLNKDKTFAHIVDWKFGRWEVEDAETNRQGHAYLLGLYKMFPTLRKVKVHFVMPARDEVTVAVFEESSFKRLHVEISAVVARAVKAHGDLKGEPDFAQATPTVSGCLFCRHKGSCSALHAMAIKVGHKYDPVRVPEEIQPSLISDPKFAGEGIKVAALMEAWAKAYRKQATDRAVNDEDFIPEGYDLVKMERREIINKEAFKQTAQEFIPESSFEQVWESATKISFGPVEDAINDLAPRGHKKEAVEAFSEKLENNEATKLGDPYFVLKLKTKKKPPESK